MDNALKRTRTAGRKVDTAATELDEAVMAARAAGASWKVIGAALGISGQAANQRWAAMERAAKGTAGSTK